MFSVLSERPATIWNVFVWVFICISFRKVHVRVGHAIFWLRNKKSKKKFIYFFLHTFLEKISFLLSLSPSERNTRALILLNISAIMTELYHYDQNHCCNSCQRRAVGGGLCAKHLGFWKVGESQRQETKFVFWVPHNLETCMGCRL